MLKWNKTKIIYCLFPLLLVFCLGYRESGLLLTNDGSARRALIYIYTHTLTGTNASYSDAARQLQLLMEEMEAQNTLRPKHQEAIYKAINALKNTDKATFNSFDFYQNHFLEIYQTLPDDKGIATHNTSATKGIFDKNFLNPLVFADLEKDSLWDIRLALGRFLFHEPLMSGNNKRSCASCHQAAKGFTDGLPKSIDFDSTGTVDRNAPTIINSVFARPYLHDRSHQFLEGQFHQVLEHPKEFRTKYWEIIRKLKFSPTYVEMFKQAFPTSPKISVEGIEVALKTYVASLTAFNSDFDQMIRNEKATNPDVIKGYNVFMGKANCGSCHYPPLFSGLKPPYYEQTEGYALGVPASIKKANKADTKDLGAALIPTPTDASLLYQFKTPSLRNLNTTAPYMHNGVFKSIDEAIDFICRGGNIYKGREQALKPVILTSEERVQLKAFLQSLNDTQFSFEPQPAALPELKDFETVVNRTLSY
jgi:cytochrome c peroxidase